MLLGNWKQNWSELHSRLQLTLCVIYIHIVLFFLFVNIGAVTNLLVIPKLESSKVDRKNLALEIPTLEKMSRPFNETQTVLQPSVLAACCIVCLQAVQTGTTMYKIPVHILFAIWFCFARSNAQSRTYE